MSERCLRAISLGAGVQSTTMALMAAHGEIGPMPDCAIFADTGDEPAEVYEHLRWLSSGNVLPFPVHVARSARSPSEALRAGDEEARIPCFVGAGGLSKRQCTKNFKLKPIRRKVRELLGVGPRGYIAPGVVEAWIGISTDEAIRKKPVWRRLCPRMRRDVRCFNASQFSARRSAALKLARHEDKPFRERGTLVLEMTIPEWLAYDRGLM